MPESYVDGLVFRQDEVIRLKIPLVAKPPPKVNYSTLHVQLIIMTHKLKLRCFQIVWFFEEEPIALGGSEIQIETNEAFTSLKIENAKRWHCGEFRVYAENENGEDACSVMVTVTCTTVLGKLHNILKVRTN